MENSYQDLDVGKLALFPATPFSIGPVRAMSTGTKLTQARNFFLLYSTDIKIPKQSWNTHKMEKKKKKDTVTT